MTESEQAHDARDARNRARLTDLAVFLVVGGGGLIVAVLVLLLLRMLPAISYQQRMAASGILFWIALDGCLLTIGGLTRRAAKGWIPWIHRLVVTAGTIGFAALVVQIGQFGGWSFVTLAVMTCIGALMLAAGLALARAWRWGGYLTLALAASPAIAFFWLVVIHKPDVSLYTLVFEMVTLIPLFAVLGPLATLLAFTRLERFPRLRGLSYATFITITIPVWIFLSVTSSKLTAAQQRSQQKTTAFSMYYLFQAVEAYGTAHGTYPRARNIEELAAALEPAQIKLTPRRDAWGNALEYTHVILPSGEEAFVIRSAGADGVFEHKDPTKYTERGVNGFERDLVFSNGCQQQWPEGLMPP